MSEISNAKITSIKLYIEDHDILTFSICCEGYGTGFVLGGYCLDCSVLVDRENNKYERKSDGVGLDCMRRIMEVVGVRAWEDLKGKYIRYEHDGWGSSVTKIGNIIDEKWIDIDKFFKENSAKVP